MPDTSGGIRSFCRMTGHGFTDEEDEVLIQGSYTLKREVLEEFTEQSQPCNKEIIAYITNDSSKSVKEYSSERHTVRQRITKHREISKAYIKLIVGMSLVMVNSNFFFSGKRQQ